MRRLAPAALIGVLVLGACSSAPEAATDRRPATPIAYPTSTLTPAPEPSPASEYPKDRTADLASIAGGVVVGASETAEGVIEIRTSIPDPRAGGDDATSAAIVRLCEEIVDFGATRVTVFEAGGSVLVVYGDPAYGEVCTVV